MFGNIFQTESARKAVLNFLLSSILGSLGKKCSWNVKSYEVRVYAKLIDYA
jgi:hypothetical protein